VDQYQCHCGYIRGTSAHTGGCGRGRSAGTGFVLVPLWSLCGVGLVGRTLVPVTAWGRWSTGTGTHAGLVVVLVHVCSGGTGTSTAVGSAGCGTGTGASADVSLALVRAQWGLRCRFWLPAEEVPAAPVRALLVVLVGERARLRQSCRCQHGGVQGQRRWAQARHWYRHWSQHGTGASGRAPSRRAFFWLVSLLLSSLVWFIAVKASDPRDERLQKGLLIFGVMFSVLLQEVFRFLYYKLLR